MRGAATGVSRFHSAERLLQDRPKVVISDCQQRAETAGKRSLATRLYRTQIGIQLSAIDWIQSQSDDQPWIAFGFGYSRMPHAPTCQPRASKSGRREGRSTGYRNRLR